MYRIRFISENKAEYVEDEFESIKECDKLMKEVCRNRGNMYIKKLKLPDNTNADTLRVIQFRRSYAQKHGVKQLVCFVHYEDANNV